ncbi:hypothetical protein D9M71_749240 [compost metagenome]
MSGKRFLRALGQRRIARQLYEECIGAIAQRQSRALQGRRKLAIPSQRKSELFRGTGGERPSENIRHQGFADMRIAC